MPISLQPFANNITAILMWIAPVLVALAVLYFVWGVVQYIQNAGDQKKRSEGQDRIIHGIIGLAVIVSMWGLVQLVREFVIPNQLNQGQMPIPTFHF